MGDALFLHDYAVLTLLLGFPSDELLVIIFVFLMFLAQGSAELVFLENALVQVFPFLFGIFDVLNIVDDLFDDIGLYLFWDFFK